MAKSLEIPISKLCGITYNDPNHEPDSLEWTFIEEIAKQTGFFMARIHLKKAEKLKYSRQFNYFEFEYENEFYILEKGKLKKDSN